MSGSFKYKSLGITNASWGVCGFTSAFYAMYKESGKTQAWLVNATHAYSVLYEIRDYLMELKTVASPLLEKIEAFTQSFGGVHAAVTIESYIHSIDSASSSLKESTDVLKDERFGLGMPPEAVADYLVRMWKAQSSVEEVVVDSGADGLIGMCLDDPKKMPYKGLVHYMYRRNGKIYSWGKKFSDVNSAAPEVGLTSWTVRWLIPVKT